MSESRLAIVIDSRQAKPTAEDLVRALDAVDAAGVRVTSSSQRAGRSAADAGRSYAQAGKDASTGAAGVDRVNRSIQQTESSAAAAGAAIRRHLIAAVGGLSAMKIIDIADEWGQLDARMKMATRSAEEHRIAQERMAASAKSTYRDINETREAFIQLSPVLRDMGMSLEQSMDAVDAFSGLLVTNAATGERAGAAMRAFALALQKGKMDADGWITIYSTMDSIVDEIAAHTGMAAEEIRKLGAEGKLSVDLLANSLAGRLNPIMQQVAEMPTTVRDAMQNLSTEFGEWVGKANEAVGATRSLAASIEVVGDNIDTILTVALVAAGGAAARYTAGMAASSAQTAIQAVQARLAAAEETRLAQAQLASAQAAMAQVGAYQGLSVSRGQMAAATTALAAAEQRLAAAQAAHVSLGRTLLGVMGGPAGLAVAAGLTATAFLTMGSNAQAASLDVGQLAASLGDLTQKQLELRRLELDEEVASLESVALDSSRALLGLQRDFDALSEAAARGAGITVDELDNVKRAILEQEVAHEQNSAALDRARHLLDQINGRLQDLDHAARGAAGGVNTLNAAMGFTEAGEKYLAQIQGRIKALQDGGDPVKAATRWINEHADASEADKTAIMSAALAEKALQDARERATRTTKTATSAINEAKKAAEAFERERRQYLNGLYGEVSALGEQARGLEQQIELYGLAESATYDYAIAQLEQEKAAIAVMDAGAEEIAILERKIELLHQMRGSQQTLERLDAEKQAWETWSRDVEQIFQQVGQSLTDAIFEGGKSGRDLIKDLFKTLTLRVLIQPVMSGLQGLFMGAGPAGVANAGGAAGSMMGSPTSLFSMFGGNSMGMGMSNVMSHLSTSSMLQGTGVGNWLMGQAGNVAGMSNLALGGAGLLGGLGANLIFGGKGHSGIGGGLGSTVGMALGGPLGAVAGSLIGGGLGSLFGDREPTTRREQRTQVEYAGGLFDVTKTDDRAPAGADAAARALAEQAVQTANEIFKQVGVDAAIGSFHAIMASSYQGDRDGVASGGMLRLGDELRQFGIDLNDPNPTIQGFGGWSSAETLPRLATDIQLSVLEAFQSLSDQLPNVLASMLEGIDIRSLGEQEAQALAERFTMLTQGASQFLAAIETMPFEQLRDLTFDAAAGMVQFAGGVDNLLASQQTYYERFYSDAERHAHSVDQLTQALAGVGVEMPPLVGSTDDMLASYRALVESLDLNTEAGQQAYMTLMQTAGAFADVAQFAGQAAEAQRRGIESAYQAVVQAGQAEIAKLQGSFAGTDAAMSAYRSKVQGYIDGFNNLFSAIDQGIKALRGTGEAFEADYARARAVISTALVTGQLPQTVDLTDVLRTAQQGVTGRTYVSQAEQERAYAVLANEMEGLRDIAAPELDTAQATLNQLEEQYALLRGTNRIAGDSLLQLEEQVRLAFAAEDNARHQIAAIESQTEAYRMQVSAITGLGSSVLSLSGAMTALAEALKLEVGAGQGGHVAYLSGNPDLMAAWMAQGGESSMSAAEWAQYHWDNYGKYEDRPFGLPSFDVGINRVPRDTLARIHKDEAVVPAEFNPFNPGARTWGGGDQETKALLREVIDRLDRLRGPVLRTASATEKTAELTDQVTEGGNATRTVSMEIVDVRVTA